MLAAIWGAIVAWDWHTYGPIVTALAAGLTAVATIVYTVGTLLLWGTTRRSVRAMEHVVKLTFPDTVRREETGREADDPCAKSWRIDPLWDRAWIPAGIRGCLTASLSAILSRSP